MKHLICHKAFFVLLLSSFFLAGCADRTPDYTGDQPSTCEVHQVEMFKRAVPFGHGVISKNPNDEQWKRRKDHYPHPGDCYPATSIIMPGETGRVLVYVCQKCEAAKKEVDAKEP